MQKQTKPTGLKINHESWQELKHKHCLTTSEVARIFSVTSQTIYSYLAKGILVSQFRGCNREPQMFGFSVNYIGNIVTGRTPIVLPWRKKKIHGVEPIVREE